MKVWFSLCAGLLLAGCSNREANNPPPSSSYTVLTVTVDAQQWVARAPVSRSYAAVRPTGSMLPLFGSNAILLVEHSDGTDLRAGDIATYQRADGLSIVHRVREVGHGAILFGGDNNDTGDGWVPMGAVRGRVAGILYASR